jgi:hypothetical protein
MTPLLPTDATPTAQQVFDAVVRHAATMTTKSQLPRSTDAFPSMCAYRGKDGSACFVGCLVTDEEASSMDDLSYSGGGSVGEAAEAGILPERLIPHLDLLGHLQPVHDDTEISAWPKMLREIAGHQGLSAAVIDEVFG